MQFFNPLERPDWDAQLVQRRDFSFFHSAAWLKVLVATYGYAPVYLETADTVLPLMEVDSWLTGKRAVALPFTDDCPPLGGEKNAAAELFQHSLKTGKSRGWKYVEIRGGKEFFPDAPASLKFYGHRLDLMPDEAQMFARMDGSMRRAIRKAESEGVSVGILRSEEAMRDFYHLQCLTRQRHGLPPQSLGFFLNIHRFILSQDRGFVAVARHGGKTIAASVYFQLGNRAIYKYGASDLTQQHLRGANLVMWVAMKRLAQMGVTQLHLGKTALANEGLRRFKSHLGVVEETIEYLKYDLRQEKFVVETDAIAGWHNQVFRLLPLFASRWAGRLLYQHWA